MSTLIEPPADWPGREHSRFLELDGIRWHFQQQGSGPAVLLVHGTGGSTHSWAGCASALARSFTVISTDLPGHGFTVVPPAVERARDVYTIDGMARALQQLLDALRLHPQVAAGHSAGVPVLLRMALQRGIAPARIVGLCAALVAPPAWYVSLIAPIIGTVVESATVAHSAAKLAAGTRIIRAMLASTGSTLTPAQLSRYEMLCGMPTHVHAALAMMARWDLPTLMRDLATLDTPLDIIAGRRDRWVPEPALRRAVASVRGATYRVEEGGHLLMEERAEEVAEWIGGGTA
ncbi:alpha/beta fold hydrolase BchO [Gemmatimonas groenlandica]|uniref:Alpha/beta fold hydrolase n=1 Tax=Gemmatimonas groenlandica TaxID=2732249 RepID=A0A6M4INH0_9BACT|nr:alpha/beta fold hydrolase BchO [Gemmatimonas groenlandica]QJR35595.1 alpha/beta fold hydrolase [Gemmatimonas groenlandica]